MALSSGLSIHTQVWFILKFIEMSFRQTKELTDTILITGGAGFIGSNFIYLILKERPNLKVVCVDLLPYATNKHTLDDAFNFPNFVFHKEDIRNKEGIYSIFKKEQPDIVVNFAAESHVDRSIHNPNIFLETNVLGTQVLLDACREYGVKHFHQVSTDEVYGDLPLDKLDILLNEESPLHPSSPYAVSKASADLLALSYYRTYGLPVTISRSGNNYGPYQFPEKLIPLMIYKAINNEPLPIYGSGLNIRDWLYVEDHCRGILSILEKGKIGNIYNLGSHNEKSNTEVVKAILKELDKSDTLIKHISDRPGHDLRYAIDISKVKRELGWEPIVFFEDGIRATIKWYIEHKQWLDECIESEQVWLEENY